MAATPPINSKAVTFQSVILQTGKNTTGLEVPEKAIEEMGGGKRPLVKVKVNDYAYRSAVAVMNGKYMISMSAVHREAGGFHGGDPVAVTLELDLEPRTVELPEDLKSALMRKRLEAFEKSAPFDAEGIRPLGGGRENAGNSGKTHCENRGKIEGGLINIQRGSIRYYLVFKDDKNGYSANSRISRISNTF